MIESYGPPAAILVCFGGLFAYASWRSAQPANPAKPRLIPWRTISVFAGFIAFLAAIYMITQLRGLA